MYGYEIYHEDLMKNLIETIHKNQNSHAYIFEGEKGLGKHEAARLFAAALTCADTDIAPCGACSNCMLSKADTNPDIIHVLPRKDKKTIGADDMRALEEEVAIKPFSSSRKVFIIDDGALLTEAAQNTFLKTFEEPPEYAVFIIIIENSSSLLQTVLSRFTLVHFPAVSEKVMRAYIEKKYPEAENMQFLLRYCEGVPLRADSVINDEAFELLRSASLEKLNCLLSDKCISAYTIQSYLEENKDKAEEILDFWLLFLRDILLLQIGASEQITNVDKRDALRDTASKFSPEQIMAMTQKLIKAKEMLRRYVNLKAVSMWLSLFGEKTV